MESNVRGFVCRKCWATVDALYRSRWSNEGICDVCWAVQNGDWPASRYEQQMEIADAADTPAD